MKRLLTLALAVGLLFAFSMPAAAVDVNFSGQWQFEGWYDNNPRLNDTGNPKNSTGFAASSLLLSTQFKVAEGLALTTRARILDHIWGDKMGSSIQVSSNGSSPDVQNRLYDTSRLMRENIEFDQLFLTATLGPGALRVGYSSGVFGTPFMDTDNPGAGISYAYRGLKGLTVSVGWARAGENEVRLPQWTSGGAKSTGSDMNADRYSVAAIYAAPTWDAGVTYAYSINHMQSQSGNNLYSAPYTANYSHAGAYGRGTFGPLFAEAEFAYQFGDYIDARNGGSFGGPGIYATAVNYPGGPLARSWNIKAKAAHAHARYAAGPAYLGAKFAYVQGDDPTTFDTNEAGYLGSGREFKPCLIMINPDRDKYLGALGTLSVTSAIPSLLDIVSGTDGYGNSYGGSGYANFFLYQGYVGFKPIDKLDLSASFSFVTLDQKPRVGATQVPYVDDKVGNELDITATYKLYDNLSYMIGFGYLWTGDAWKGSNAAATVGNDWLLMHKLTLSF